MKRKSKNPLKIFLTNNNFVRTTAIFALVCSAISMVNGSFQFVELFNRVSSNQYPNGLDIMVSVWIFEFLIPLAIYFVCWLMLSNRRRAERIFYGFLFSGVYFGATVAFQTLHLALPIFAILPNNVSVWLQFWPVLAGMLMLVVIFMGFYMQKSNYNWQILSYWTVVLGFGISAVAMSANNLSTLYYNQGARFSVINYEGIIQLVVILGLYIWMYRKKSQNIIPISISFLMWIGLSNAYNYINAQLGNGQPVGWFALILLFVVWVGFIVYAKIPKLISSKS